MHSLINACTNSPTHSLSCCLTHCSTHSPTHSLIHSLTHSLAYSLSCRKLLLPSVDSTSLASIRRSPMPRATKSHSNSCSPHSMPMATSVSRARSSSSFCVVQHQRRLCESWRTAPSAKCEYELFWQRHHSFLFLLLNYFLSFF